MEPATGYLILVAGTSVVWLAGETTWKCALWVVRRPSLRVPGAVRAAGVVVTIMVVAASWRVAPAVADVIPPSHRAMAIGDVPAVEATSTVTFASMLESARRSLSRTRWKTRCVTAGSSMESPRPTVSSARTRSLPPICLST